jgi:THO complex subunit 2
VNLVGLPPLGELVATYGVPPALAFHISRPALRASITRKASASRSSSSSKSVDTTAAAAAAAAAESLTLAPWAADNVELHDAVKAMLPATVWDAISPAFYQMFWSYSLYDIKTPKERYQKQMKRILQTIDRLKVAPRGIEEDSAARRTRRAELRAAEDAHPKLKQELATQNRNKMHVLSRFESMKDSLLPKHGAKGNDAKDVSLALMTHCILPRMMLSPADALYCAEFVLLLHQSDTPGFSTLSYFNVAIKASISMCVCLSEREAAHLGIFLCETLRLLSEWKKLRGTEFRKRCTNKVGFAKGGSSSLQADTQVSEKDFVKCVPSFHL